MGELNSHDRELVALGAAIASNCVPCVEYHVPAAREAGLSDEQIEEAVRFAERVRRVPANTVLEAALAMLAESPSGSSDAAESECGCTQSSQDAGSC